MADLFGLDELVDWMQVDSFPTSTLTLARTLVTTRIRNEVGPTLYDSLADVSGLKPVALDVAKRMLQPLVRNERVDDYSVGYAVDPLPPRLSEQEIDEIRSIVARLTGVSTRAYSIRPA